MTRVEFDKDNKLMFDEFVTDEPKFIHIERMGNDMIWMAIETQLGERHILNFFVPKGHRTIDAVIEKEGQTK